MQNLILVDIETSGLDRERCGIMSIGAVDYNSDKEFYLETYPGSDILIEPAALKLNGLWLNDKLTHIKDAVQQFVNWSLSIYDKPILGGECFNQFDAPFLCKALTGKTTFDWPFRHRFVDIHTIVYFLTGKSLSLKLAAEEFGLEPEPAIHNALNGAKKAKEILYEICARYYIYIKQKKQEKINTGCNKCGGEGWLWAFELDRYYGDLVDVSCDDTRYPCDRCQ